jgi:hypothetical protein
MKNVVFCASLVFLAIITPGFPAKAQELKNPFSNFSITNALERTQTAENHIAFPDSQIKNIQVFGERSGIAYTPAALFRTDDDGENWREIALPKRSDETIGAVFFSDEMMGWAILADRQSARLRLAETNDGGNNWSKTPINLLREDALEADLENAFLQYTDRHSLLLSLPLPTSSNFRGESLYESLDGGNSWQHLSRSIEKNRADEQQETNSR